MIGGGGGGIGGDWSQAWENVTHKVAKSTEYCRSTTSFILTTCAQLKRLDFMSGADAEFASSVMSALVEAWRGLVGCGVLGGMVEDSVFLKDDGLMGPIKKNSLLPDAPPDVLFPKRPSMIGAPDPKNSNLLDFDVFNTIPTAEDLLFRSPISTTASNNPGPVAPPTGEVGKHIDNNLLNLQPPSAEGKVRWGDGWSEATAKAVYHIST
jgi:hypothetical protein